MTIIPLFILTSGQIAVQVNDESGNLITHDMGLGVPFGTFHLTEISKLKKWAAENNEKVDLPHNVHNYEYLPRIEDSHLENLLFHLKETRVVRSERYRETRAADQNTPITPGQNKKLKNYETNGDFEYCSGNYPKAIEFYKKALGINPRNTHALAFMGHCFFRMGKRKESISCYNKVKEIDPAYTDLVYKKIIGPGQT